MKNKIITSRLRALAGIVCALLVMPLAAIGSECPPLQSAPINSHDLASLQSGARTFVNYCLGCHSAGYMRYSRLQDIGLSEQQIKDNLIFTGGKVGDLMLVAMDKKDGKQWFGVTPPDLTVEARARSSSCGSGADWVYSYLRGFYRDSSRPTGWNNLVFENVAMPHALWELNGVQQLKQQQFESENEARAALLSAKLLASLEEQTSMAGGKEVTRYVLKTLEPGSGAKLSKVEYDKTVTDLVNYMNFMAEPARLERRSIGIWVLLLLSVLFVLVLLLKWRIWKDVH